MAAYSMPFSARDVLASYPSAQLSAVDRDTEIFKFGQILTNSKNPKARLIAGRALSKVSPGFQEAQIERLAGDNFSQKQFQAEQRESMALQKKYIEDRSSYMEQKTNHRLLKQSLVSALGTPSTQRGTPFSEMELDEQIGGGGSVYGGGSGSQTPASSVRSSSSFMGRPISASMVAAMEGGLSDSFWGGASAGSRSARQSEAGSGSWEEEEFGLGVEPVNINMDPTRLAQLEILRSNVLGDRLREGAIGSLLGEMVSGVSGQEAVRQFEQRLIRLQELGSSAMASGMTSMGEIANPNDLTEADVRTMARFQAANRKGFFGRSELRSDITYAQNPFEQETNAFSNSIEAEFGQQNPDPEFGSAGSLALASGGGGAVRRRGRPVGYTMSEESRAKIGETRRARALGGEAADIAMSRTLTSLGRPGLASITAQARGSFGPYTKQQAARQKAQERRKEEKEGAGGFSLFD